MNFDSRIRERLSVLAPLKLELIDESEKHRGHAGWKDGGGTHWQLSIVSTAFDGKPTVARHRMVYHALGDLMDKPIHALSIRALAPGENGA